MAVQITSSPTGLVKIIGAFPQPVHLPKETSISVNGTDNLTLTPPAGQPITIHTADVTLPAGSWGNDAQGLADVLGESPYFFSGGSSGGGNIDAGTVNDSMNRWNTVAGKWVEDPNTLDEDEVVNNNPANASPSTPTSNFLQKILTRFSGAAEVWFQRAVTRLNSGSPAITPNPNGTKVAYGSGLNVKSLTTAAAAAIQAVFVPSIQKAYALIQVANATLTGSLEISVEQGMKFTTIGLQPTYRTYTAANDSFTATTQDQVINCVTGSYATTIFNGTVNLPASPLAAQRLTIFNDGEGQIIINGNGRDIMGASYVEYISTRNSACELQYNGTRWIVLKPDQSRFFGTVVIDGTAAAASYTAGLSPVAGKVVAIRIQILNSDIGAGTVLPFISATGLSPMVMNGTDETFVIDPTFAQSTAIELNVDSPSDYTAFEFRAIFEFKPF